ncbi:hypothetical protein VDG1235_2517 [Verrucomicrobiia bacterium DG1235]|nr:hypothetical protein VDG1235_2517 [Verrucomicrobiae bacterium DG1235]
MPEESHTRFNVIGSSGSGKSTFSRRLARQLDIPYVELDAIYWGPDWTEPDDQTYFQNLDTALSGDSWVLDGNYSRTTHIKWKRVQSVIWLDLSFTRALYQSLKRTIHRAWTQKELWPGTNNRESFRKSFLSRDSIILWAITSHAPLRKRYLKTINDPAHAHIDFIRLRSHQEVEAYLSSLKQIACTSAPTKPQITTPSSNSGKTAN